MKKWGLGLTLTAISTLSIAQSIDVMSYNVEGGYLSDAKVTTVASYLKAAPKADIYGFSELTQSWSPQLKSQMGEQYRYLISDQANDTTDALALFFDSSKFKAVETGELVFNEHKHERPALYARLKDKRDNSEFIVMVNHLMRGDASIRQRQSKKLQAWVSGQTLPVVALGDYNFDYDVPTGKTNQAYREFVAGGYWQWVKPTTLIKTGCHKDYNSILDFVFVANGAKGTSEILFAEPEYCNDDEKRPDHRPVFASVMIPVGK
ncbi:hypothetical protein ACP3V5_17255 [Vibrio maritimus]